MKDISQKKGKIMRLREYLDDVGIPISVFARRVRVTPKTIHNILNGKEPSLSVAVKIAAETRQKVSCTELLPSPDPAHHY
jgi:plasmid maintenance system antidote protein VapI